MKKNNNNNNLNNKGNCALSKNLYFSRDNTPILKSNVKSEFFTKNNSLSLDFKVSPNKKIISQIQLRNNTRTNSMHSFLGHQTTDSSVYPTSNYMTNMRYGVKNGACGEKREKDGLTKSLKQKNGYTPKINSKNPNLYRNKIEFFSVQGLNKLNFTRIKNLSNNLNSKKIKRSYLINPASNIQINFNTVGNSNFNNTHNNAQNKEEKVLLNVTGNMPLNTGNSICLTKSYMKSRHKSGNNRKITCNVAQNFRNRTNFKSNKTHCYYNNINQLSSKKSSINSYISNKLKEINVEILSLFAHSDSEFYPMIINKLESIFKKIINRNSLNKSAHSYAKHKVSNKSVSEKIPKFFKDDEEFNVGNCSLKLENENLSKKIGALKKKIDNLNKDNSKIKADLSDKTKMLNDMKLTIDVFNKELKKLQKDKSEKSEEKGSKALSDSNLDDLNNVSLAENLNIDNENYRKMMENRWGKVGNEGRSTIGNVRDGNKKFGIKLNLNSEAIQKESDTVNEDFNAEFLKNYDNFSESWRREVDKMLKRRGKNN